MSRSRRSIVFPLAAFLLSAGVALAQPAAADPSSEPFQIKDNSFLVEEAFNQDPTVVQNIFGVSRMTHVWQMSFTQEWPAHGLKHQLSYSLAWGSVGQVREFGDVLLNYRYQVLEEGPGRPAFAPRLSVVLPTGRTELPTSDGPQTEPGLGFGSVGLQVALPFSKQHRDWYFHGNAGFTWLPRADSPRRIADEGNGQRAPVGTPIKVDLFSPHLGASAIYRLRPMLNAMLEWTADSLDIASAPGVRSRQAVNTLSPGVRGGWNFGEKQIVIGAAVPVTWTPGSRVTAVFGYFSLEMPFWK